MFGSFKPIVTIVVGAGSPAGVAETPSPPVPSWPPPVAAAISVVVVVASAAAAGGVMGAGVRCVCVCASEGE